MTNMVLAVLLGLDPMAYTLVLFLIWLEERRLKRRRGG
jgi:hypothetical protein